MRLPKISRFAARQAAFCWRIGERQHDPEGASFTGDAFHFDDAFMLVDDRLGDGEAEARTAPVNEETLLKAAELQQLMLDFAYMNPVGIPKLMFLIRGNISGVVPNYWSGSWIHQFQYINVE